MEEVGVLTKGTNRVAITLMLDTVQQSEKLGTGYDDGKAFRFIKKSVSNLLKRSAPNSHRDVYVSSLGSIRKGIKKGVFHEANSSSDEDAVDGEESSEEEEEEEDDDDDSNHVTEKSSPKKKKKKKSQEVVRRSDINRRNRVIETKVNDCLVYDRQSIAVQEMFRNNKLIQPLSVGDLETTLNEMLRKQDVVALAKILEQTTSSRKVVLWEMLKVCLNISLKDKNEMKRLKAIISSNGTRRTQQQEHQTKQQQQQENEDRQKVEKFLADVANQPLSAVQTIVKFSDRCSASGLNPKFGRIPDLKALKVTEFMFNPYILASQLVFTQNTSPVLEASMTTYLNMISNVAKDATATSNTNVDLKKTVNFSPKPFLAKDLTSQHYQYVHVRGTVNFLRTMNNNKSFQSICNNMVVGLYSPFDKELPKVVESGSPHKYTTINKNDVVVLVDDGLDVNPSPDKLKSLNLVENVTMFTIKRPENFTQIQNAIKLRIQTLLGERSREMYDFVGNQNSEHHHLNAFQKCYDESSSPEATRTPVFLYRDGRQQAAYEIDPLLRFVSETLSRYIIHDQVTAPLDQPAPPPATSSSQQYVTPKITVLCFSVLQLLSRRIVSHIQDLYNSVDDDSSCDVDVFTMVNEAVTRKVADFLKKNSEISPSAANRIKASINKELVMGYTEHKRKTKQVARTLQKRAREDEDDEEDEDGGGSEEKENEEQGYLYSSDNCDSKGGTNNTVSFNTNLETNMVSLFTDLSEFSAIASVALATFCEIGRKNLIFIYSPITTGKSLSTFVDDGERKRTILDGLGFKYRINLNSADGQRNMHEMKIQNYDTVDSWSAPGFNMRLLNLNNVSAMMILQSFLLNYRVVSLCNSTFFTMVTGVMSNVDDSLRSRMTDTVPVRRSFDTLNLARYKSNKQYFGVVGSGAQQVPPPSPATAATAAVDVDTESLFDENDDESYMDL